LNFDREDGEKVRGIILKKGRKKERRGTPTALFRGFESEKNGKIRRR